MQTDFSRHLKHRRRRRHLGAAFTLVEVLVGMIIMGITFAALYGGMTYGITSLQMSRESLRATQLMSEKLDTIRLYAWDKVVIPGYISNSFTAAFVPGDPALAAQGFTGGGVIYCGTVTVSTNSSALSGFSDTYKKDLCEVSVSLAWTNGAKAHSARMTTLVAREGLQTYVY
jgi:prepilin-type N-terminal cleavage/methylation domain-containing protein